MIRKTIRILEAIMWAMLPVTFVAVPVAYWWQNPHLTYMQVFAHWWWWFAIGLVSCLVVAMAAHVYYGHDD